MDRSKISYTQEPKRKSLLGSFIGGFGSGAVSGALMLGIYTLVASTGLVGFLAAKAVIATIITTGIFSGVMGAKRALTESAHEAEEVRTRTVPVIVQGMSPQVAMDMEPSADMPAGKWADRVGAKQDRVQAILDNGAMGDKDRAAAILAARENADNSVVLH